MGDFYPDPKKPGQWIYDEKAPTPGHDPAVTMIYNRPGFISYGGVVDRVPTPTQVEHPDHDLQPVPTSEFPSFDEVDSRTIADMGAPD